LSNIINKNKTTLHDKPLYFEKEGDALSIEVAIQYNDGYARKFIVRAAVYMIDVSRTNKLSRHSRRCIE